MRITVWGARGSIPVSGADTVRYGGDTTCVHVLGPEGTSLVLDMGTGIRALGNSLASGSGPSKHHVLITHAHWDHLQGFPFFVPLYLRGTILHFHGCSHLNRSVRNLLADTMVPPFFPVDLTQVAADLVYGDDHRQTFDVGEFQCRRMSLNHPNGGCGFVLEAGDRRLAFFPDNELGGAHPGGRSFGEYVAFLQGVDVLIHDAEYLPEEYETRYRGWGHSVFLDTVRLAREAGVGRLLLWHHKPERTDDQVDAIVAQARAVVAETGSRLEVEGARTGLEIDLGSGTRPAGAEVSSDS